MAREHTSDLLKFLQPFGEEITGLALWLRDFVWKLYPKANELIYDNYNALAFGWSITDKLGQVFCNIAIGRTSKNVHFGFFWGSKIPDPEKLLLGQGNQYRYMLVKDKKTFPKAYIKTLLNHAYVYSLSKVKEGQQVVQAQTIVKSVSGKKREKKIKKQVYPG